MSAIEWHGARAYSQCATCGQLVRLNKPLFGGLHICLTECETAGRHLDLQPRRRGPFWARRTEMWCVRCDEVSQ